MIILGIDPGTRTMGYGVIESEKDEAARCCVPGAAFALRANLAESAGKRRWSILRKRAHGTAADGQFLGGRALPRPRRWCEFVNEPQTEAEVKAIRNAVNRGQPYGSESREGSTAITTGTGIDDDWQL